MPGIGIATTAIVARKPPIIGVNAAIYSAISDAIGKAPAPIKAGLFLYEQAGGILQVGIAAGTDNQGRETKM
jgi:hypothetical protein